MNMFRATIFVSLKESVLDPEGVAVRGALHAMGYTGVEDVRIGKRLEVRLDAADRAEAERQVKEMCEKLLANPVIEQYAFELKEE
jgi:phosphoribosylformylglycinamidine synthase